MTLAVLGMKHIELPPSPWEYARLNLSSPQSADAYLITWNAWPNFYTRMDVTSAPIIIVSQHAHDWYEREIEAVISYPIEPDSFLEVLARLEQSRDYLVINTKCWTKRVYIPSIVYIESIGRKLELHTKKHVLVFNGSLKEVRTQLGENFVKPHRSFLVNRNFIIDQTKESLELVDGTQIPIARSRQSSFKQSLEITISSDLVLDQTQDIV